jgi:hypothetical protein
LLGATTRIFIRAVFAIKNGVGRKARRRCTIEFLGRRLEGGQLRFDQLCATLEEVFEGDFLFVELREERALRGVVLVVDTGFSLEETPCFSALDAEEDHLAGERHVENFSVWALDTHVDAEVWNE